MTILLDLSIAWSYLHVLVLFIFLYDSRYSRRTTVCLTALFMIPLGLFNLWYFMANGPGEAGQALIFTCTFPSLFFFFFLARNRDSRFFFTFCLADTISFEIIAASRVLSYYLPVDENLVMLLFRLAAFPLLEWLTWRYIRKIYLELQQTVKIGWAGFVGISALFYVLLVIMCSYPTLCVERPDDLPALILVMVLMPCMYWNIFRVLRHQQALFTAERERNLLHMQSMQLEQQMHQIALADERLRIERHDRRHRIQALMEMLEQEDLEGMRTLLGTSKSLTEQEDNIAALCANPILNATLTAYFRKAENAGIQLHTSLHIPPELTVNEVELATVFANALENAINACEALPKEERWIRLTFISLPHPMFELSNSCQGTVTLAEDGLPVPSRVGHGLGTRSIRAFCEKNNAFATYETREGVFVLRVLL